MYKLYGAFMVMQYNRENMLAPKSALNAFKQFEYKIR